MKFISSAFIALCILLVSGGWWGIHSIPVTTISDNANNSEIRTSSASFPINAPQTVSMTVDNNTRQRYTPREWRDQMLDWLLMTALSESGLSAAALNQVMVDLPSTRFGYMRPVADFEYGSTRSKIIHNEVVVAIIPAGLSDMARSDHLVNIADNQRINLGNIPKAIRPFEYVLADDGSFATLTRKEDIPGQNLFTEESGYRVRAVTNEKELTDFLKQIDDLVMVRRDSGSGLELGGRKLRGRPYHGVDVEHVAAIWQAELGIKQELADLNEEARRIFATLPKHYSEEQAYAVVRERLGNKLRVKDSSGFSLDPVFDYDGMSDYVSKQLAPLFVELTKNTGFYVTKEEMEDVVLQLKSHKEDAYFAVLQKLSHGDLSKHEFSKKAISLLASVLNHCQDKEEAVNEKELELMIQITELVKNLVKQINMCVVTKYTFQTARYDGNLQGTSVGMNLFYTDLLAKLWALDYHENSPSDTIEEFSPLTEVDVSPVFIEELKKLSNTRLWFGPLNKSFQREASKRALYFSRNGTRVFAASSDPLYPGKEAEPNAASEAFLGWWNDHYEEIATYEPEYERLNEIMKWSLVIGWLHELDELNRGAFLAKVKVNHSHWFPDWVKKQPELKFQDWSAISFYPAKYKGVKTEALPKLSSEPYYQLGSMKQLSGGVSLGGKRIFKEDRVLANELPPLLRRTRYQTKELSESIQVLKTYDGMSYRLSSETPNHAVLKAFPKENAKPRSRFEELAREDINRSIRLDKSGLSVETSTGQNAVGDLTISRSKNGFQVGWKDREQSVGLELTRRLSRSFLPEMEFQMNPAVKEVIALECLRCYAVKLDGSSRWLKVMPEEEPSVSVAKGWNARAADPRGKMTFQMKWVEEPNLITEFESDGHLLLGKRTDSKIVEYHKLEVIDKGKDLDLVVGDRTLKGKIDPKNGDIQLPISVLKGPPPMVWKDLHRIVSDMDRDKIRLLAKEPGQAVYYKFPNPPVRGDEFPTALKKQEYHAAAKNILQDAKMAQQQVAQKLKEELKQSRAYADSGDLDRAIRHADETQKVLGMLPDLSLYRGLLVLKRNQMNDVLLALQQSEGKPFRSLENFFDEVNHRIKTARNDPVHSRNLHQVGRFADWNHQINQGKVPLGKVKGYAQDSSLKLAFHESEPLQKNGYTVVMSDLPTSWNDTLVYVQDSPSLNHLDWQPSAMGSTLHQILAAKPGSILSLSREDLTHFRPSMIYSPDQRVFKLVNEATNSNIAPKLPDAYRSYSSAQEAAPCNPDTSSDCPRKESSYTVYYVMADETGTASNPN